MDSRYAIIHESSDPVPDDLVTSIVTNRAVSEQAMQGPIGLILTRIRMAITLLRESPLHRHPGDETQKTAPHTLQFPS